MDTDVIRRVIANLRDPLNIKERVHFTSRAILFLTKLFNEKYIDVIDLHCLLLRIAYIRKCYQQDDIHISCKDLVVYLLSNTPTCITVDDVKAIADVFDDDKDSEHNEVRDMHILVKDMTE